MLSTIDQMIQKYGGEDEAYKLKLKTGIRDAFGYSNYVSRLKKNTSAPADIGDVSGLSPAGINARISSRFGTQSQDTQMLETAAGAIDTAAGTLAAQQVAREKAAAAKAKAESEMKKREQAIQDMLNPPNWAHQVLNSIYANPYNSDGSLKTKEQIRTQLINENKVITGDQPAGMEKLDENTFNDLINSKLGDDWEQAYKTKRFEKMGFTKAEAQQQALNEMYAHGGMDSATESIMEKNNPNWKKEKDAIASAPDLLKAIEPMPTNDNAFTVQAKQKYTDLQKNFPNVDETTLKKMATPTYEASLRGDIYKTFSDKAYTTDKDGNLQLAPWFGRNTDFHAESLDTIKESTDYKDLLINATVNYEGILSAERIRNEIEAAIISGNPLEYVKKFHTAESDVEAERKSKLINDPLYRESVWDILK